MIKSLPLFLLISAFYCSANPIELRGQLETCQKIDDTTLRLDCYDKILSNNSVQSIGNWQLQEIISPLDQTKSVYLILPADKSVILSNETLIPKLFLRCKDQALDMFIDLNTVISAKNSNPTITIDEEPPITDQQWFISLDRKAFFYQSDQARSLADFLEKIATQKQYTVAFSIPNNAIISTSFRLNGLNNALPYLKQTC